MHARLVSMLTMWRDERNAEDDDTTTGQTTRLTHTHSSISTI